MGAKTPDRGDGRGKPARASSPGQPGQPEVFAELSQFVVDPSSVQLLKHAYCLQNYVVVLGVVDRRAREPVTVGMLNPGDRELLHEVSGFLRRPVSPVRLNDYEIRRAIEIGNLGGDPGGKARLTLRPQSRLSFEPDAAVTQRLGEILGRAVLLKASDVHFETYEEDVDVRFRIDGVLEHVATALSKESIAAAISRIKVLAGLDIAERRVAQDGRISAVYEPEPGGKERRNIDFRVSVVPGPFGEDAVLRLLDSAKALIGLERLGFTDQARHEFERLIANPEGLVLVCGPTGSGKTTTLYAAIQRVNTPDNKILTVEDPIEYCFPKTNQKQVSSKLGFAAYARAFLRQNPDIILIGEVRDEETADVAIRAAQTGHLVLSTLHTNDAVRAVSRFETLGIAPAQLAGSLLGSLSQRLVRALCASCRTEAPPSREEQRWLGERDRDTRFFAPRGCAACDGKGYRGRTGIYELFSVDDEMADWIAASRPIHELRRRAIEKGMRTLLDDALDKARKGQTSLAEIIRVIPYRILAADRTR